MKKALVTGASSGLGKYISIELSKKKIKVIGIARNKKKLEALKKIIGNKYFDYVIFDLKQIDAIEKISKIILMKEKFIDILINNAGIYKQSDLQNTKISEINDLIDTNLKGTYNCCKAVSKYMLKQKFGKIINISSVIGEIGNKGQVNYAASKAGIIGLTKSLSKELGSRNININAINPGFIKTKMTQNLETDKNLEFLNKIPLNRFGTVDEVSNLAYFLASKDSDYITGQTINIDGGMVV